MYPGQPVTAYCGDYEYLCFVVEDHGNHKGVVDAVATIDRNDALTLLDEPVRRDWMVVESDRAFDLYKIYEIMQSGKKSSEKFNKEDVMRYSIKGRMI